MNYFAIPGFSSKSLIKENSIKERIENLKAYFIFKGCAVDFLESRCRKQWEYVYPRHIFRYILHIKDKISTNYFECNGLGDHATILHSCKVTKQLLESKDREFTEKFRELDS